MKSYARLMVLVPLYALWGCSSHTACKDGTILLTVDLSENGVQADTLAVDVTVEGAALISSNVTVPPGETVPTIAVEFPGGYPAGKTVLVNIDARAGGLSAGFGGGRVVAPAGCGTLIVVAMRANVDDGGAHTDSLLPPSDARESESCVVGVRSCRANIVITCDANGALVESEECTGVCQEGNCVGECTPGALQCASEASRTCSAAGTWSATTACPAGCANGVCLPACAADTTRCDNDQVQSCMAGVWGTPVACENVCRNGACAGECKPTGAPRCTGQTLRSCSADGQWVIQETCEFVCTVGGCAGQCVPDSKRCNDAAVEVCTSTGTWQNLTTCENACSNGVCTPKVPGKPGVPPTASVAPTTATKVREGDVIIITFTEQMDTASVEAAFKSTTAGAAKPTFKWTPDKTVLTVDPKFTYPKASTTAVAKGSYAFTLGNAAKDANGEALQAPVSASYALLYRRITPPRIAFAQRDAADKLIAGNLIDGSSAEYTFLQAALTSSAKRNDAFVTFALPALPAGNRIEQALFISEVESVAGSASGAGNFRIADTIFLVPLTSEAFKTSYRAVGEALPSSSVWTVGAKVQFAVTTAVVLDYNRGDTLTQFRLYLDGVPNASSRVLRLLRPQTFLEIVYLIE